MDTQKTEQQSLQISQTKLLAIVRELIGGSGSRGREDDEHPLPHGPGDPVIRAALERIKVFGPRPEPWQVFGPQPEPWQQFDPVLGHPVPWRVVLAHLLARHPEGIDGIGGNHRLEQVGLNPQPLPPGYAFLVSLAQTVISRAELIHEIADATRNEGGHQGSVSSYLTRFVDEFCGTGYRLRWPFPGPRPHWWHSELSGIDLIVIATQFEQAAKETFSSGLRQNLADASGKFAEAGLSRI